MPLVASGVTHQGRRSSNEDAVLVDLRLGLFLVADGMGGHNAGEIASHLAVESIHKFLKTARTRGREALEQAVRTANTEILTQAAREADYSGMGTTVVAALINGRAASYTSVGDSRLYLWRQNDLAQLTQDDSWLTSALADVAAVDSSLLQMHPMRHVLTRVVGLRAELEPSANQIEIENSDMLLLCSDGLHGSLSDSAIASVLSGGQDVPRIAERLVEEALARGATDNVTALVIRWE